METRCWLENLGNEVPQVPEIAVPADAKRGGVSCIMSCKGSMGARAEFQRDLGVFAQEESTSDDK